MRLLRRPFAAACLLYLALAVIVTWPVSARLSSVVSSDAGDPILNTWILWWNAQHAPLTASWWTGLQFYPFGDTMAYSEHLLGLAVFTNPLLWLGVSPLATYNLMVVFSFAASAAAAHLLVHRLTGRHDVGLIAGLAFGFHPYRISQLSHLQVLSSYWMPIALLALHRYLDDRRVKWLALFGGAWLLQSLTNGYFLAYFSLLLALWTWWFLVRRGEMRALLAFVAAALVAAAPLAPILWKYDVVHAYMGMRRGFGEISGFSADITSVLSASQRLAFTSTPIALSRAEGQLFPGVTLIVLIALAFRRRGREPAEQPGRIRRIVQRLLTIFAAAFGLAAAAHPFVGAWSARFMGVSVSVANFHKPLTLAIAFLLLRWAASVRVAAAYRARSWVGCYAIGAVVLFILALGPNPHANGEVFLVTAPYYWLMSAPGFDQLRVPARFAMPMFLCLVIVAAASFERLTAGRRRASTWALTALVACGLVADGWTAGELVVTPPPLIETPPAARDAAAILELPMTDQNSNIAALYRSMHHGYRIVNGYSGFDPAYHRIARLGLDDHDDDVLTELARDGPLLVAIDEARDADGGWRQYLAGHAGVERVAQIDGRTWFRLPRSAAASAYEAQAAEVMAPIVRLSDQRGVADVAAVTDHDLTTRWGSRGPQRGDEQVVAELGDVTPVNGVRSVLGVQVLDYPRRLAVDVSIDGSTWDEVWQGKTVGLMVRRARTHPGDIAFTINFPVRPARFIRLRQLGADREFWWSIVELAVLRAR